jgi:hypothetical protein
LDAAARARGAKAARKKAKVEAGQRSAAARAAAEEAARVAEEAALHAACDAAEDAARAATAPPPELMVDGPRLWLTNCDGPGAQPARNAAHDEFDALHLLWHNTGLGAQRALFVLHHCDNTPEQREALIEVVKRDVEAETATKKAAQPGIKQRYREHNNDQQRLYVCACCGERNKEATGKYTRVPLRYKRVSVSREKLTAAPRSASRSGLHSMIKQLKRGECVGR